jgi:hypothetical protein
LPSPISGPDSFSFRQDQFSLTRSQSGNQRMELRGFKVSQIHIIQDAKTQQGQLESAGGI